MNRADLVKLDEANDMIITFIEIRFERLSADDQKPFFPVTLYE